MGSYIVANFGKLNKGQGGPRIILVCSDSIQFSYTSGYPFMPLDIHTCPQHCLGTPVPRQKGWGEARNCTFVLFPPIYYVQVRKDTGVHNVHTEGNLD